MRRRLPFVVGILAVAIVILLWELISSYSFLKQLELPAVARNLPTESIQANVEFNNRVQAIYRTGTKESELIARLSNDGFETYPKPRMANSVSQRFPCALDHWVEWKVDKDDVVVEIKGTYDYFCL
jgi:hypothetical protein